MKFLPKKEGDFKRAVEAIVDFSKTNSDSRNLIYDNLNRLVLLLTKQFNYKPFYVIDTLAKYGIDSKAVLSLIDHFENREKMPEVTRLNRIEIFGYAIANGYFDIAESIMSLYFPRELCKRIIELKSSREGDFEHAAELVVDFSKTNFTSRNLIYSNSKILILFLSKQFNSKTILDIIDQSAQAGIVSEAILFLVKDLKSKLNIPKWSYTEFLKYMTEKKYDHIVAALIEIESDPGLVISDWLEFWQN